jgi:aspartokinase
MSIFHEIFCIIFKMNIMSDTHQKEIKNLKFNHYIDKKDSHTFNFILKNKKTNQIVSINAESPVQAASYVGWRPRNTILMEKHEARK